MSGCGYKPKYNIPPIYTHFTPHCRRQPACVCFPSFRRLDPQVRAIGMTVMFDRT